MCNIANPILDQERALRTSTNPAVHAMPRDALRHGHLGHYLTRGKRSSRVPGPPKSARRGFISRLISPLSLVVGLLLLGASQAAWATSRVKFNGVASTVKTSGITLDLPVGVAVDASSNVYIADTDRNQIVKVNPQGVASVLTISGLSSGLAAPGGLAVDSSGTLYIADSGHSRIVEVSPSGSGLVMSTGSLSLNGPEGVAIDASGNIFIADTGHSRIVEVPFGGKAEVSTISGLSTALGPPSGLAVDILGNLYIADPTHQRIVTVAAGGAVGSVLTITGLAALANPSGVAVDTLGNVYIADTGNGCLVRVEPGGEGSVLSTGNLALNTPQGVAVTISGTVYVADTGTKHIVAVATSAVGFGHVQMRAGSGVAQSLPFTVGVGTTLGAVKAFTVGAQNLDFTVADGTTCTSGTTDASCTVSVQFLPRAPGLRRGAVVLYDNASPPNPLRTIPLFAFADAPLAALAPNTATVISTGSDSPAQPFQIALDGSENLYARNDAGNKVVIVPAGGGAGSVISTSAEIVNEISGLAFDGAGNLFIADQNENRIVVVTPGGVAYGLNIRGLSSGLDNPSALAFDAEGNLYIADSHHCRIVKVSSLGMEESSASGVGTVVHTGSLSLGTVTGVAVDAAGTIYIADPNNDRVVQVTAAGATSLLNPSGLTLNDPQGVSADGMGNIYVADSGNNRIVEITTAGVASVVSTPGLPNPSALSNPQSVTVDPYGNLFVLDGNNGRIVEVPVSGAFLAFPSTKVGLTTAPSTARVTNLGNQPLVFAAHPTYTPDFSENASDTDPCTSATTLSAGEACDVSVEFTPKSAFSLNADIMLTNNAINIMHSTQRISVSGAASLLGDTTATMVSAIPSSLNVGQRVTLSAKVTDTTSGNTSNVPTGQVGFTDTLGSTVTSLNNGIGVNLNAGQATLTSVVLRGAGTHTITAIYEGVSDTYLTSMGTTMVTVNQASVTLTVQSTRLVFGQAGSATVTVTGPALPIAAPSGTISYNILNASTVSVASGTLTLTAGSTSSTATIPVPNNLPPGDYILNVTYSGDSNYQAVPTATPVPMTVNKGTPTVSLASSLNPVLATNPVTFTATVSSTAGTPTGTVSFLDGQTLLTSTPLAQGVATYTTSSLVVGTHSISAIYSGDTNFASVTSTVLIETVGDFTLTISTPLGQSATPTVLPGGTLNYVIQASPTSGETFPSEVTFSASGFPAGATATFTPATVPAGSAGATVNLAIQFAQQIVARHPYNPLGRGLALAMVGGIFLLPFGRKLSLSRSRAGRFVGLLLLAVAATCATLGVTACGGTRSGYFAQQPRSFTVTVTATSGALSHTATVSFILE